MKFIFLPLFLLTLQSTSADARCSPIPIQTVCNYNAELTVEKTTDENLCVLQLDKLNQQTLINLEYHSLKSKMNRMQEDQERTEKYLISIFYNTFEYFYDRMKAYFTDTHEKIWDYKYPRYLFYCEQKPKTNSFSFHNRCLDLGDQIDYFAKFKEKIIDFEPLDPKDCEGVPDFSLLSKKRI